MYTVHRNYFRKCHLSLVFFDVIKTPKKYASRNASFVRNRSRPIRRYPLPQNCDGAAVAAVQQQLQ